MNSSPTQRPRVGLFATCLVDLFRPAIGFAAAKLIEDAGCDVYVPEQTCCGQPAYNSGDRETAKSLALQVIESLGSYDYVVVPSGSCAGMLKKHYPTLFADDPNLAGKANAFAEKIYELASFLTDVMGVSAVDAEFTGQVTYHDSCSGLRELGIAAQPRKLLASVRGLELVEMAENDICCGFGGTFAAKYGEISTAIVEKKDRQCRSLRRARAASWRSWLPYEHGGKIVPRRRPHRGSSLCRNSSRDVGWASNRCRRKS
jgi:L-lactate dehydrogenase complex protein LldE